MKPGPVGADLHSPYRLTQQAMRTRRIEDEYEL
jgi:hypothetical protein